MSGAGPVDLRLGFIPLVDCAPLAVARETGLFAAEGLNVTLSREASWANVRDKVQAGLLDGAHMLGPMTLAASLGVGGERVPMIAPLSLNLNGSAITVSTSLAREMRALDPEAMSARPRAARALARAIQARRDRGDRPLAFATVFPFSMHNYELRWWMAEAGVDPDRDLRLTITPPPRMAARLRSGEVDGFCVGAPWNAVAVSQGAGEVLAHASELWRAGPDKVLGVTADWAARNPDVLRALLRALLRAQAWADAPENRDALVELLARAEYVDAPAEVIRLSFDGASSAAEAPGDHIVFHRYAAGFPWLSHAGWFLAQMLRWGQIDPAVDIPAAARGVYRPDLYRAAASEIAAPAPLIDEKLEGAHAAPWMLDEAGAPIPMPADSFFDGRVFDLAQARRYAASFDVGRLGGA